jgi:hypothetical protein
MSFDSARFVFIVGHYKSGSTWLLNMLSLHPEVRGVQETYQITQASVPLLVRSARSRNASALPGRDTPSKHCEQCLVFRLVVVIQTRPHELFALFRRDVLHGAIDTPPNER